VRITPPLPLISLLTQDAELSTQDLYVNAAANAAIKTQFGVADIADIKHTL
jgi:hypothetical protein